MTWKTLRVKYDDATGDHYLQLTPDILRQAGWDFGDTLSWTNNNDGSWTISKKEEVIRSDNTPGNDGVDVIGQAPNH